ncbi:hypothetical protein BH20ACT18_BH20ACT18_06620 [soil metagenome]
MAAIDDLPPDQRAVLQLLLKQGQSYDGIAALLGMDAGSVRARAHAALESLGPESGRRMSSERRAELADYLLGQLDEDAAKATHDHLAASARGRAWARVAAGELRPLAGDAGLPAIPEDGAGRSAPETPVPAKRPPPKRPVKRPSARTPVDPEAPAAAADESERPAKRTAKRTARTEEAKVDRPAKRPAKKTARQRAEVGEAKVDRPTKRPAKKTAKRTAVAGEAKLDRPAKRPAKRTAVRPPGAVDPVAAERAETEEALGGEPVEVAPPARQSSQLGGALLIGGVAILAVVLLIWLFKGNSDSDEPTTTSTATNAATAPAPAPNEQPRVIAQVRMNGKGKADAVAQVLVQAGTRAIAIVGKDLQPSSTKSAYAVWLYNSATDARRLGFAPPVGKNGRLEGVAPLPRDFQRFREVILTRETSESSKRPGAIVLRGKLASISTGGASTPPPTSTRPGAGTPPTSTQPGAGTQPGATPGGAAPSGGGAGPGTTGGSSGTEGGGSP